MLLACGSVETSPLTSHKNSCSPWMFDVCSGAESCDLRKHPLFVLLSHHNKRPFGFWDDAWKTVSLDSLFWHCETMTTMVDDHTLDLFSMVIFYFLWIYSWPREHDNHEPLGTLTMHQSRQDPQDITAVGLWWLWNGRTHWSLVEI